MQFFHKNAVLILLFTFSLIMKLIPVIFFDPATTNSDEAVMGLMGLHASQGSFPLFFYGQAYGGGPQYLLVIVLFKLFPPSIALLRLSSVILLLATEAIFYSLLKHIYKEDAKRFLALAAFMFSSSYFTVFFSGVYETHLNNVFFCAALAYLYLSHDEIFSRPIAKGLVLGMGFWVSDVVVIFLLALLPPMLLKRQSLKFKPVEISLFILSFIAGALPKLYYLINPESWHVSVRAGAFHPAGLEQSFAKFLVLLLRALPQYFFNDVIHPLSIQYLAYALICFSIMASSYYLLRSVMARDDSAGIQLYFGLVFYFIMSADIISDNDYGTITRYLFPCQFFISISIANLISAPFALKKTGSGIRYALAAMVLISGLFSTAGAYYDYVLKPDKSIYEVIEALDKNKCESGFADYSAAYKISFLTQERIKLSTLQSVRIRSYDEEAKKAGRKCYLFADKNDFDKWESKRISSLSSNMSSVNSEKAGKYLLVIEDNL